MSLWTEQKLKYYEIHTNTVEGYAKNEIIDSLGIITTEEKDLKKLFNNKKFDGINLIYVNVKNEQHYKIS